MEPQNSEIINKQKDDKSWKISEILWTSTSILILLILNVIFFLIPLLQGESPTTNDIVIFVLTLFATTFGVMGAIATTKKLSSNYIYGIIHVITYGTIAYMSTVYGDFILNLFIYLPMSIYGFYYWVKRDKKYEEKGEENPARSLSLKMWLFLMIGSIISILLFSLFLITVFSENSVQSIFDSISTVISVVGMILMMLYFKEQWIAWVLVDSASVVIWIINFIIFGELYSLLFVLMWSIYTINAFVGLVRWYKESNKKSNKKNSNWLIE